MKKKTFVYKTTGDCRILADVFNPSVAKNPSPVILWIHGGSFISGSRGKFATSRISHLQGFLSEGYTVVSPDYRLAPETSLPAICEDAVDACNWIHTEGPELFQADPEKIAAVGYSAGGFLALHCGYRAVRKPKVVVSLSGYGDVLGDWTKEPFIYKYKETELSPAEIRTLVGKSAITSSKGCANERAQIRRYLRRTGTWAEGVCGTNPESKHDLIKSLCPLYNISDDFPPTLLVHGEADTNVPYRQSLLLAEELARHGIDHKLVPIPDGGHGFETKMASDPKVVESFGEILRFLRKYLPVNS